MRSSVLYNFISPITGRVPLINEYILIGSSDNFSIMSPKLIDMQLDIINIRHYIDNVAASNFIVGFPNDDLPKAQVLSNLDNGYLYNTDGIVSTTNDIPLPSLTYKNIWIGDSNNLAQPQATITIDNLPNLGTTSINVPNPLDPTNPIVISGGKIWHGTDSNRPEESNALLVVEGDIALINFRFFSANFILGKGNSVLQTLMPGSQFLSNLPSGSWMQTSGAGTGAIVAATIPQGQILMGGVNNIPESQARIQVENLPLLAQNRIWVGDVNSIPQSTQVLDISNLPALTNGYIWQGDAANRPVEVQLNLAPTDATYIIKTPNATLTQAQVLSELGVGMTKIVAGGAFAIAIAGEDYATTAQLEEIEQQCQQYAEQAATSAEEAATSAGEAATSAGEATASAGEATGAAAEATGAAAAASGSATAAGLSAAGAAASAIAAGLSAGSASSSASDASSSASDAGHSASSASGSATNAANSATAAQTYLNTLLNTGLTLLGDVTGSGLLNNPIVTTFKPNPIFSGNGSMTMPAGNSIQRPTTLIPGMLRFNTSL